MYKILNVDGYEEIMKKYHLSSLASKAMVANNLTLTSKLKISDPYKYKDMDKVIQTILKAINDKKKIVVYGDYDVDGICSVAIIYRTFKLLNYEIGYYLPNRYEDGYGITIEKIKQMKDKGYSLIICVDNGIKAFEAIEEARKYDMDVIVLDHHQKDDSLPNFTLYLHPEYSSFSSYNMCATSICYNVSKALLNEEDEKCLALVGIATIGDVMPLVDQNKILVKKALEYLNTFKYQALNILNNNLRFDEMNIAMNIVPKLNSVGRICKGKVINKLITFLTSNDDNEIKKIASFIEKTNNERKVLSDNLFNKLDKNDYKEKIIVEKDDEMLEGLNGIIAAKFTNKYHLPTIIFSLDESKFFYKGSARSIDDFDINELLKNNCFIEKYGGHKKAAGLTIKKENYDLFSEQVKEDTKDNIYQEECLNVIEINEEELSYKSYLDLVKFSPFGEGNPSPLFLIKNIDINRINKSKDNKHLFINFNKEVNLVGFNLANNLKSDIINYDVIFKLELNNMYDNKISCKCLKMEESLCMNK